MRITFRNAAHDLTTSVRARPVEAMYAREARVTVSRRVFMRAVDHCGCPAPHCGGPTCAAVMEDDAGRVWIEHQAYPNSVVLMPRDAGDEQGILEEWRRG